MNEKKGGRNVAPNVPDRLFYKSVYGCISSFQNDIDKFIDGGALSCHNVRVYIKVFFVIAY